MLVGDARGLHTTNWYGRWRVTGKWYGLRCNCVLVQHIWYVEYVLGV